MAEVRRSDLPVEWVDDLIEKLLKDHEEAVKKAEEAGVDIPPEAQMERGKLKTKFRRVYGMDE